MSEQITLNSDFRTFLLETRLGSSSDGTICFMNRFNAVDEKGIVLEFGVWKEGVKIRYE